VARAGGPREVRAGGRRAEQVNVAVGAGNADR
jgi:hypothetical protein